MTTGEGNPLERLELTAGTAAPAEGVVVGGDPEQLPAIPGVVDVDGQVGNEHVADPALTQQEPGAGGATETVGVAAADASASPTAAEGAAEPDKDGAASQEDAPQDPAFALLLPERNEPTADAAAGDTKVGTAEEDGEVEAAPGELPTPQGEAPVAPVDDTHTPPPLPAVLATAPAFAETHDDRDGEVDDAASNTPNVPLAPVEAIQDRPERKSNGWRRLALAVGAVALVGGIVAAAVWAARYGTGDMTGVIAHALPKRAPLVEGGDPSTLLPGSTAATQYSAEALTITHGEAWLNTITQVVPGITQEQATTLLKEVGPQLLQIKSNTGEAIAYPGAPGGLGINESDGRMPISALDFIRAAAIKNGLIK